jgi:hypothetical protein
MEAREINKAGNNNKASYLSNQPKLNQHQYKTGDPKKSTN